MRKFTLILILLLTNIFVFAQTLSIDFQLNTNANAKTKNHLNWTLKSTANTTTTVTTTKDFFDAVSSASKKHSTKELREVYIDSKSKKQAMPKGLYTLLLFAVSSPEFLQNDDLKISSQGKKLTIQFIHRGIAYKISTNEKGYFDFSERTDAENGFYIAKDIAENEKGIFSLKADFVTEGTDKNQMQNADWTKFTFENDSFDKDIDLAFAGKLKTSYKNGILKIKGKLTKKVPVQPKADEENKKCR
ncbi:hypothetical protein [Treponema zioleckii]|uniref:hypothetical protein n=1 Tax=Treponema zioleckii TaxID=331680 RepID=UPI00168BABEE|nr:hypothetical protein [Treponema zioleckii]